MYFTRGLTILLNSNMKKAENENVKLSISGLRIINVCHLHMKRGCPWVFVSLRVVCPRNEPPKYSNNLNTLILLII